MSQKSLSSFSREIMELMPQFLRGTLKKQQDALVRGHITLPQFLTMDLVDLHGSLKMKDIASALKVSLPAASVTVDRLFKTGLVKRVSDQEDRRVIYVTLSPRGKKLLEEVRSQRRKIIEEVFGKLSEKERQTYLDILRKLINIMGAGKHEK